MKVCSKCKIEKDEGEFYKSKEIKNGLRPMCKICTNKLKMQYRLNNYEKIRDSAKKYRLNNYEKIREKGRIYYLNNSEKFRSRQIKYISNLSEQYVKQILSQSVKRNQITPELIEWKRVSIQIKRLIKEKQK